MSPKNEDRKAQDAIEERDDATGKAKTPPAGPHATEEQTDHDKTPGAGSLPDDRGKEADVGPD